MNARKACTPLFGDGTSCVPGCSPPGDACHFDFHAEWSQSGTSPHAECSCFDGCSYPPEQLKDALELAETDSLGRFRNNEVVVDTRSVVDHLPRSVLAFWVKPKGYDAKSMHSLRRDFLEAHGLPGADDPEGEVPVVVLDLAPGVTPFRLARSGGAGGALEDAGVQQDGRPGLDSHENGTQRSNATSPWATKTLVSSARSRVEFEK